MNIRHFGRMIFDWYEKYPLTLNTVVGGVVYIGGEVITEVNNNHIRKPARIRSPDSSLSSESVYLTRFKDYKHDFDWHIQNIDGKRTACIGALGSLENGVVMVTWYRTLSRVFGEGVSTRTVLIKCLFDQLFFASQQDGLFLGICAYIDSSKLPSAIEEVKKSFLSVWLLDCALWPMVNFIGFSIVPYSIQPTYVAFVQFFWQIYVSSKAAKDAAQNSEAMVPHVEELKAIFEVIDLDKSGYIDAPELMLYICQRQGQSKIMNEELVSIISEVDEDGDGRISLQEFESAVISGKAKRTKLWATLHEDVALLSGSQMAMKRFREFQNSSKQAMVSVGKDGELKESLKGAGMGCSMLAMAAVTRRLIFKL
jgi:hypothetical protein